MSEVKIKFDNNRQKNQVNDVPLAFAHNEGDTHHSDEIDDIITAAPSWLLRCGITLFFSILVLIVGLSAFIRYPDIVKAPIKINSLNSPKPIVPKISGKLIKLLVNENQLVKAGQSLAYLESTADHPQVLTLLSNLKELQQQVLQNKHLGALQFDHAGNIQLGELQSSYQTFYQEYITYLSTIDNGFLLKKMSYFQKDLYYLKQQQQQLNTQKMIQQRDFSLADDEYEMHKKLEKQQVETKAELRQEESKYLAKKAPLVQTESSIVGLDNNYATKQRDILELNNQIQEERSKFLQAINSLLSNAEDWKSKYVLSASQKGKLSFAGIIQENQVITQGQEIFYVDPGDDAFFGELAIPQNNMGKVTEGQEVLVKLKSYPFEQYGMIKGKISYIANVPFKDSVFISKVNFKIRKSSDMQKTIHLKQGMLGDAEIVTQDASILQRLSRNIIKALNKE